MSPLFERQRTIVQQAIESVTVVRAKAGKKWQIVRAMDNVDGIQLNDRHGAKCVEQVNLASRRCAREAKSLRNKRQVAGFFNGHGFHRDALQGIGPMNAEWARRCARPIH